MSTPVSFQPSHESTLTSRSRSPDGRRPSRESFRSRESPRSRSNHSPVVAAAVEFDPHHVVAFDAHAFAAENPRRASNSMTPSRMPMTVPSTRLPSRSTSVSAPTMVAHTRTLRPGTDRQGPGCGASMAAWRCAVASSLVLLTRWPYYGIWRVCVTRLRPLAVIALLLLVAAPARADVTGFIGADLTPTSRRVLGGALGIGPARHRLRRRIRVHAPTIPRPAPRR